MKFSNPTLVLISTLLSGCTGQQQIPISTGKTKGNNPLNDDFKNLVEEQMEHWKVPGMAIGVVDGDEMWNSGYGYAEFPNTKATPSTLWMVGSTSKAFTAAAMSLIINNSSSITWQTPISNIIRDDFVLQSTYATNHVTIEDALSHRTGMPRHDYGYGSTEGTSDFTLKSLVRSLRHMPLSAELRAKYQYCNMMYQTVAYMIETLVSKPLGVYLKDNVLEPLGMTSTYFNTEDALASPHHLARGYSTKTFPGENTTSKITYYPVKHEDLGQVTGAGSIASNVLDYQKWIKSWLASSGALSNQSQHANLIFPRIITSNTASGAEPSDPYTGPVLYARAWNVGVYHGHQFIQHSGGMEAFSTNLIIFPSLQYGTIAFGNTASSSYIAEEVLQWKLIDDKLVVPEEQRFDWNGMHERRMAKKKAEYDDARKVYFPNAPKPGLPTSLALKEYAATYNHGGYGNFTVFLNETTETLQANRAYAIFAMTNKFEHVSGEHFLVRMDSLRAPGPMIDAVPAEFKIGSDGRTMKLGIALEEALEGEKIWFDRM